MVVSINANPGQTVGLSVQVLSNGIYGHAIDGYVPSLNYVLNPDGSSAAGFPVQMTRVAVGTYRSNVVIPSGSSALGTYLASVSWQTLSPVPEQGALTYNELFLINVALPFGNSSVYPV